MSAAAHSQPTTTLRYLREDLQQTGRVAQIRQASRSTERKRNADE
jgi:hypothetical protein